MRLNNEGWQLSRLEIYMRGILDRVFARLVRTGSLEITFADDVTKRYGDGGLPFVRVRLRDRASERRLILNPALALGEAYMDGGMVVDEGTIYDFLQVLLSDALDSDAVLPFLVLPLRRWRLLKRRLDQRNRIGRAKRNVAHHYDLNGRLYDLFLDLDRQYSCAYFEVPDQSLEEAQAAKKRHIAAKLLIEPDHRVLDIGSGWGGLGLYLARNCQALVVGVTLSEEQYEVSRDRAAKEALSSQVDFRLTDYRGLTERFDRIVSVGMFEHVGVGHYPEFFAKARDLLAPDGVMLLHTIGRSGQPGANNPWLDKYIFPGGNIPALSEILPIIERAGLVVTDIEILRLHYAETLKAWRRRFRIDEARRIYDERFCRMWEFYLAGCECAFRFGDMVVFQVQLVRRQQAVPLTRAYIEEAEGRLRDSERHKSPQAGFLRTTASDSQ